MMQLWRSGMLHFIGDFPLSENKKVSFRRLSSFLSRSVIFAAQYYSSLGYTDEMLSLNFRIEKSEDLILFSDDTQDGRCRIPELQIHHSRTASDLASGSKTHAARLLRSATERFNFEPPNDDYFADAVKESLQR
jgi:hypothetical protein